jgi:hypothetical protein
VHLASSGALSAWGVLQWPAARSASSTKRARGVLEAGHALAAKELALGRVQGLLGV